MLAAFERVLFMRPDFGFRIGLVGGWSLVSRSMHTQ